MNKENIKMIKVLKGKPVKDSLMNKLKEDMISNNIESMRLLVIQIGNNDSSNIYINNKIKSAKECNILTEHKIFDKDIAEEDLLDYIDIVNMDKTTHGIIVQLPIPEHLDPYKIANRISPIKDVDGLTNYNQGSIVNGGNNIEPCTPKGIMSLLDYYNYDLESKDVVIVGRSSIVGKPLMLMMTERNATVTLCHSKTRNIKDKIKNADVVVLATGNLKMYDSSYFSDNQLLIDVGIGLDDNNKLCGDLDIIDIELSSLKDLMIVPSPGGCGQTTVATLLSNVLMSKIKS